jgi:hypothetical protein
MAQGENAKKIGHCGREYWSRRPGSGIGWGQRFKEVTHRRERRQATRIERDVLTGAGADLLPIDYLYFDQVANDNGAPDPDEGADG